MKAIECKCNICGNPAVAFGLLYTPIFQVMHGVESAWIKQN